MTHTLFSDRVTVDIQALATPLNPCERAIFGTVGLGTLADGEVCYLKRLRDHVLGDIELDDRCVIHDFTIDGGIISELFRPPAASA